MKRFDVIVEGHYPSAADREYCDDGAFVDADIAEDMLEALVEVYDYNILDGCLPPHITRKINRIITKLKGTDNE